MEVCLVTEIIGVLLAFGGWVPGKLDISGFMGQSCILTNVMVNIVMTKNLIYNFLCLEPNSVLHTHFCIIFDIH